MSQAVKAYQLEIEKSLDQIITLVEKTPNEQLYWKPSEQEWSIIEVLGHVKEIVYYWVRELQGVIVSPDKAWGRGLDAKERLEAIMKAPERTLLEVTEGIQQAKIFMAEAFKQIKDSDLDIKATHRNPKFGTKPMSFLVEHFLVEHLEKHVSQIKRVQQQYEDRNLVNK